MKKGARKRPKCILLKWNKPNWKDYVLFVQLYDVKTVKQGCPRYEDRKRWIGRAHMILGQWNYSAGYYSDGYMSLHICQNLQVQLQAWTLL